MRKDDDNDAAKQRGRSLRGRSEPTGTLTRRLRPKKQDSSPIYIKKMDRVTVKWKQRHLGRHKDEQHGA